MARLAPTMPYVLTVEMRCIQSSPRQNVDVLAEEVFRVVLRLDLPETREVRSVCHGSRIDSIVFEIVQVPRGRQKRREGRVGVSSPGDAALGLRGTRPLRNDDDVEARR